MTQKQPSNLDALIAKVQATALARRPFSSNLLAPSPSWPAELDFSNPWSNNSDHLAAIMLDELTADQCDRILAKLKQT